MQTFIDIFINTGIRIFTQFNMVQNYSTSLTKYKLYFTLVNFISYLYHKIYKIIKTGKRKQKYDWHIDFSN